MRSRTTFLFIDMNDITKLASQLQSIGLNDKQAKVYVTLLFLGPSRVKAVAEQTGLKRPTTYLILEELLDMGLVSQSQEGEAKIVVAEPPEAIERFLDEQIDTYHNRKKEFASLAGALSELQNISTKNAPKVRFYRGKEGEAAATRYVRSHSKNNSIIYGFGNMDEVVRLQAKKVKENPSFRVNKNISSQVLYSSNSENELLSDKKLLRTTKKVPMDVAADINLQEDFAVITTYEDGERLQMIIESKPIVQALRQLHELAWDNYKPE